MDGVIGVLFEFWLPFTVSALVLFVAGLWVYGKGRRDQARYYVESAFIDAVLAQPPVEVRAVGVAQVASVALLLPHPREGE